MDLGIRVQGLAFRKTLNPKFRVCVGAMKGLTRSPLRVGGYQLGGQWFPTGFPAHSCRSWGSLGVEHPKP